jgi:iron-sulfur cluster insertion protein
MIIDHKAEAQLNKLWQEENDPSLKFRVFVQGGGCSGMQYGFTFDADQNDDDFAITCGDLSVLVDSMSMQYLNEAKISFREDDWGSSFVIENPQATTTCGCGSSFSVA